MTEADYFADDDQAHRAVTRLGRAGRAARRGVLLTELGDVDWRRAQLHTAVFGLDPYSDDDPTPQAVWMADSARLLWILGEAEYCRAQRTRWPLPSSGYVDRMDERTVALQHAVDHLLDEYVAGRRRRPLIRAMYDVWFGLTRGQAVESVYCLGWRLPWWSR